MFVLAHFAHHLLTALPVPLLPFIRNDFNLDYTQSALVVSAFSLAYGVSQLPAGWLADRVGPHVLITVGILGVAVAGVLVGLSQTFIMLLLCLVLMGLAGGGYHPAAASAITSSVGPAKRGRVLGIHLIGGSGSYFLAPIVAAAIAAAWGWRGPFLGLAVPAAVIGIIFYFSLRRPSDVSQVPDVGFEHFEEEQPPAGYLRRLVPFMIMTVFTSGMVISAQAFIPLYAVDYFGVSESTAASLMAVIYSAGLWAGLLGGYISDRVGRIMLILVTIFIASFAIYLLNVVPMGLGFGVLLLVLGIANYARMPMSEAYIVDLAPKRYRSTVYGIYYFGVMESGAVFAPLVGFLIDRFGFHTCFTVASVAIVAVTLICSVFLWRGRD